MFLTVDWKYVIEKSAGKDIDRTMAITQAAHLELILMVLLKSHMRRNRITDKLFEDFGPLSSFSAKIDCAYALRLINEKTRQDLTCVRKIRNKFAHSMVPLSFADSPIREWCKNLSTISQYKENEYTPRERYRKAIYDICDHIVESVAKVPEVERKPSV
jgi:DNA-binding MltR family transcriptional regulator